MSEQIIKHIVDELMQLGEDKFFKTLQLMHMFSEKTGEKNSEIEDLRAKLEAAEKDIKRHKGLIHRQHQRNVNNIGKMEQAEQERDELKAHNVLLVEAIGKIKLSVLEAYREKAIHDRYYDLIIFGHINPLLEKIHYSWARSYILDC